MDALELEVGSKPVALVGSFAALVSLDLLLL